jgi:hypothetical protein
MDATPLVRASFVRQWEFKSENGVDLTGTSGGLWIESGIKVPNSLVTKGPRVGLNNTPEPWLSKPWRFLVKNWRLEIGD